MTYPLSEQTLPAAVQELVEQDGSFAKIVSRYNLPPLWQREPGFATLIHIILEQQVSLASANAAYKRLQSKLQPLTPGGFLTLTDTELRQVGFSRQKTSYGRALAQAIVDKRLDLASLEKLDDQQVRDRLMTIKGIGLWTANIYLLLALKRPDIWPNGDLALHAAIQQIKGLPQRPTSAEAQAMSVAWQPWRAVAARLLWHFYLTERQQTMPQ